MDQNARKRHDGALLACQPTTCAQCAQVWLLATLGALGVRPHDRTTASPHDLTTARLHDCTDVMNRDAWASQIALEVRTLRCQAAYTLHYRESALTQASCSHAVSDRSEATQRYQRRKQVLLVRNYVQPQ